MPRQKATAKTTESKPKWWESMSAKEVAAVYAVTAQAVGLWWRSGCPKNDDGTWDLADVIKWREENIRAENVGSPESDELEKLRAIKVKREELAYDRDRGLLIEKAAVEEKSVQQILTLKSELLAAPSQLAAALSSATTETECERILRDRLEAAIRTFSDGKGIQEVGNDGE